MTWIRPVLPSDSTHPLYLQRLREAREGYPPEYGPPRPGNQLPAAVARDSIVASHGQLPDVMFHMFAGFRAMAAVERRGANPSWWAFVSLEAELGGSTAQLPRMATGPTLN